MHYSLILFSKVDVFENDCRNITKANGIDIYNSFGLVKSPLNIELINAIVKNPKRPWNTKPVQSLKYTPRVNDNVTMFDNIFIKLSDGIG